LLQIISIHVALAVTYLRDSALLIWRRGYDEECHLLNCVINRVITFLQPHVPVS